MASWASTGLKGLDVILGGLQKGDNVVWQVDSIDDFRSFVEPFITQALRDGRKVVYMRFAGHEPLVRAGNGARTYNLDARGGFETFSAQVHRIISEEGKEVYYVFDCLSDLLSAWATDLMIGNFFMITCPYLFELDTITYFALLRKNHSFKTIARIRETTQLLLDLYNFEGNFYIHPLKVWKRYSPTMFLPHLQRADEFVPITNSVDATRLISYISEKGLEAAQRVLDYWDRLFLRAEELSKSPSASPAEIQKTVEQLCTIMIGRERRILALAKKNFSLEDLLNIKSRLIGTGFVGGKTVGMLLANKIIRKDTSFDWNQHLEPHDSFYVGSDVFYTYLVENGWWPLRVQQKTKEGYFRVASELRERMLHGEFPDQVREQFQEMIEYFGQSPIIVRSSSLLEDAYGNAFAGKYESLFCVNQGSPEERYSQFENTVRRVYASTMNEDALTYRLQRGLDQQDEQMALLVQRVSGSHRNGYFLPDLAGVGISHNTFVWNPELDPKAGMLRLVLGLGTRAVNRVDDDYPRIVALDAPLLRPLAGMDDVRKYSQHKVDLLDTKDNNLTTVPFQKLLDEKLHLKLDLVAVPDSELAARARELGKKEQAYWLLTFEKLLADASFIQKMQRILKTLEQNYQYPVDIEFTVNFTKNGKPVINLLQCRPLQTKGLQAQVKIPSRVESEKILFQCEGYFMGGSICQPIKRIIYVRPEAYERLPLTQKYDIARLVGSLNKQVTDKERLPTLLLGPGRWGTTTPSLGVPVSFSEINNIAVLGEIAYEGGNLMPELSFGTHFFQDLVETDIFYVAIFPGQDNCVFNSEWFEQMPNLLCEILPERARYEGIVKVYDPRDARPQIIAEVTSQKVVCFLA
ncbi:MAG TPA: PEP/pyruvate-binding domain-containing protein [Sedimentisphaerales bacterium]|nr:PEP/pyruvate-binding domain-containing protein [Sedimentisphaerales bacterium]